MARFVSRYAQYRHGVQNGRMMVLADGQRQELVKEIIAVFKPARGILTEEEIQFGVDNLNHKGLPIDRDTNQAFSPRSRLSGLDTAEFAKAHGLTPEEEDLLISVLRSSPENGQEFIEIAPGAVKLEKPWATYDKTAVRDVIKVAKAAGVPFADVLTYEKANRNDAGVIALLEDAVANEAAQEKQDDAVVIEA